MVFYQTSNGRKPNQIIIFRDGVSKSRFKQVSNVELEQIIKAITHLGEIKLQFMLIVAQKAGGCTENVTPGRVVDTGVVHPRSYDFYMCACSGAIGTSCHAHSYVLLNGVGFSPHDSQKLLHSLSSVFVAASIVVPCQLVPKREPNSVVAVALDGDKRSYKRPRCGWDPFFRYADCRRIIIAKNLSMVFSEAIYGVLNVRTARVVAENMHGNLQLIGFDLACCHCRGIVGLGFVSLTFPRWDVFSFSELECFDLGVFREQIKIVQYWAFIFCSH
ncbi:protein argonaute 2-like [Papaver somniferum]|uniref:protein argonaute 2-like n=1 Tax=Papaver somniferum TaxID=3469 RepID=UPI000E6FFE1E|nr:protein argonaute 2-like [Papaver somniferum]